MESAEALITLIYATRDLAISELSRWLAEEGPPYTVEDLDDNVVNIIVRGADQHVRIPLSRRTWEAVQRGVRERLDYFGEDDPWIYERFEDE